MLTLFLLATIVFFVKNSSLFVGDLLDTAEAVIEDGEIDEDDDSDGGDRPARDRKPLPD